MSEPGDGGESGVSPPAASGSRGVAITLAAALLLLAALAGTAPFWAPSLPWAPPPADPRIGQIEQALQQIRQEQAAAEEARRQLDRRVADLAAKPPAPAGDIADLRQQVATSSASVADLQKRLEGFEYKHERLVADVGDLAQALSGLGRRLDAIDKAVHSPSASGSSDAAIILLLLQIRDALAAGQPFATQYEALTAAARNRPQVIAAAAPLAAMAKSGVATRAVLAERLRQLTPAIAKPAAPEPTGPADGWGDRLLDRLSGLVRVRRIDGSGGPARDGGAVAAAEQALAEGDLATAVAAVKKLGDGAADAARPWLDIAEERLAGERAVQQTEAALLADVGGAATPSAGGTTR